MSDAAKDGQRQLQSKRSLSRALDKSGSGLEPNTSSKRQRVSRACDQCRNTRAKCNGEQPTCVTCVATNRTCTYSTTPKKRGIQAGYVRSLELTLAWLLTNDAAANKALETLLREHNGHGQSLVTGRDTSGADRLYDQWKQSTIAKGLELLLSGQDLPDSLWETVDVEQMVGTEASESQRDLPFASSLVPRGFNSIRSDSPSALGGITENESGPAPVDAPDPYFMASSPLVLTSHHARTDSLLRLSTPQAWHLLNIYFSFTHCWFPIVEKASLLRTANSYPQEGLPVDTKCPGSGAHAELHSALALASYQQAQDAESLLSGNVTAIPGTERDADGLFSIALALIPLGDGVHEIGHVRALMLLSLLLLYQRKSTKAWLFVGFATRLLFGLVPRLNVITDSLKCVMLGCAMLDITLSVHLQRTPYFRKGDIARIGFIDANGLDEWQAWSNGKRGSGDIGSQSSLGYAPGHTLSIFNSLAELIDIFSLTFDDYQASHSPTIEQMLRDWECQLPQAIRFYPDRMDSNVTPQLLLLHSMSASTAIRSEKQNQSHRLQAEQRFLDLCELYIARFGVAFLPSVYRLLLEGIASTANNDSHFGTQAAEIRSKFNKCHTLLDEDTAGFEGAVPDIRGMISSDTTSNAMAFSHHIRARSNSKLGSGLSNNLMDPRKTAASPNSMYMSQADTQEAHMSQKDLRNFVDSAGLDNTNVNDGAQSSYAVNSFAAAGRIQNHSDYDVAPNGNAVSTANIISSPVDLNILFDDLMDTDSIHALECQPDFMQNLGFGPDFTSTDAFYEQFDPFNAAKISLTDEQISFAT